MDEAIIVDLKQFISTTVSQQLAPLHTDIKSLKNNVAGLKTGLQKLEVKIDHLSTFVFDTLDDTNSDTDERLNNHEHRLRKLETRPT